MDHIHYEFDAERGNTIEVSLDRAANVQLLDSSNYDKYRHKQSYQYYGGYATKSPVLLAIPRDGLWHVVIDLGGGPGQVRTSARLLAGAAV